MTALARFLCLSLALAIAGLACGSEAGDPTPAPATAPATESRVTPTSEPAATTASRSTAAPTATEAAGQPTAAPEPTATIQATPEPTTAVEPRPTATEPPPTESAEPTPLPEDTPVPTATPVPAPTTAAPVVEPQSFVVGEGSQITFTVEEELARAPIRFDAVISSTSLNGIANLDGTPSEVTLDLHSLQSDQSFRDRYIRDRMFPGTRNATVTVEQLPELPQSFLDGEETSGSLAGSLRIGDRETPLTFDVVARHDGDVINVLGRTTFTWDQLGIATPVAGPVVYLADEVQVQVLIVAYAP